MAEAGIHTGDDQLHQRQQNYLLKLSDTLRSLSDAAEIEATACRLLGEHLGVDHVYYPEINVADGYAKVEREFLTGATASIVGSYPLSSFGWALVGLRRGLPVVVEDIYRSSDIPADELPAMAVTGQLSLVSVPLTKNGVLVGALCASKNSPRSWRDDEVELVRETLERTWAAAERARAEAALRASEEKYRTLFDTIDEGFCIVELFYDAQGNVVDLIFREVNQSFERQSGYPAVVGTALNKVRPNLEKETIELYDRVCKSGKPVRIENYVAHRDRWYSVHFSRIGRRGSCFVAVVFDDITERKRRERTSEFLLKLSDTLRPLSDAVDIENAACRLLGEHLGASRVFYPMLNEADACWEVEREFLHGNCSSMIGRHSLTDYNWVLRPYLQNKPVIVNDIHESDLIAPQDIAAMEAIQIPAVLSVPLVKRGVLVGALSVTASGPRRWKGEEVELVRETLERTWAAAERARTEEVLRESEEHLRLALEAARAGTWQSRPDTGDFNASARAIALHGLPAGSKMSCEVALAAIFPEDRARVEAALSATLETGAPFHVELRTGQPDGSVRWLASHANLRTGPGAKRLVGLVQDITERKNAEEALARVAEQLVETDRRKDEFLAMLGHELRNPLAAVLNAVEVLETTLARPEDQNRQPMLLWAGGVVRRQVRGLTRLVDDLLDISRISRGKIDLKFERVLLSDVVARAVESVRPAIDARQHALEIALPDEPITIEADPARVTQILTNLLGNSAKFSDPGGQIVLSAAVEGDEVAVRVADSGIGIAAALMPHIFDAFTQGERGPDRHQGGLGLGLSLVKRLAEMHGGSVAASSAGLGRGSEFVVRLPTTERQMTNGLPVRRRRAANSHLRVLVVDDNIDSAESLALLIESEGHEVQVAHDAESGLHRVAAFRPQAIVLDIGLPGIDGYEMARRLRVLPVAETTMLIAVTGYGEEEDRRRSSEVGFHHHLVKPVNPGEVLQLLQSLPT